MVEVEEAIHQSDLSAGRTSMSVCNVWTGAGALPGVVVLVLGLIPAASRAEGPIDLPTSNDPRVPVATVVEAQGLIASEGPGEPFQRVLAKEKVYSRDLIVVLPGLKSVLEPVSSGVTLTLWGNLPGLSDSPVLESSVILHDTRAYDIDVTLVRGRIVLTNNKEKGPARIWLRGLRGVEMTLAQPGDSVALELYGRWRTGIAFSLKNKPEDGPTLFWEINVLKGNLDMKAGRNSYSMAAAPGPSYFHGNSQSGPDPEGPQRRAALPKWADPKAEAPAEARLLQAVVKAYRDQLKSRSASEAGQEFLALAEKDTDPARAREARRLVLHALAATDQIERVVEALENVKHPDMRKSAVIALRHWIGAAPGRDEKLFGVLRGEAGYSKAEAEAVMQLLHSPFNPEQPETFEALIAYLKHSRMAVRELAAWHLYRLAPAGRDIAYNAAAPAAERNKAADEWKKLIPSGELPPRPKEGKSEKSGRKE
jgi:hypothetical protein